MVSKSFKSFKEFQMVSRSFRVIAGRHDEATRVSKSFKGSNVQMFKGSNVQMFKCSDVQMFKCSTVHGLKHRAALTQKLPGMAHPGQILYVLSS